MDYYYRLSGTLQQATIGLFLLVIATVPAKTDTAHPFDFFGPYRPVEIESSVY